VKLRLPYPPSANRYWRNFRGRMVVSKEAKAYKECVSLLACGDGPLSGPDPFIGPVRVNIDVYRPRKAGDLDNKIKILLDSIQGVFIINDSQVHHIEARLFDEPKQHKKHKREGYVEITISAI